MANPRIYRSVADLLRDLEGKNRRVLDVSCKRGTLLQTLQSRGFDVRGTHFEKDRPSPDGIPVDGGVDLLRGLPYKAESYDVVILVEVIEHLENHRAAIGELARVLKPGGVLILTTPNIMRLSSRLHFFLSGYHKTKRRFIPFDTPLSEAHRFHVYPIDLPFLYYLFRQNDLEIERTGRSRIKPHSWLLFVLLLPFVVLYTWFHLLHREGNPERRNENKRFCRWLLKPRVLLEDNFVLRLRKRGPEEPWLSR